MRILALETTEAIGSVAAASDSKLLAELELSPNQRSAASLAPALQDLLKTVGWRPGDVQLVATTIGPGSFTGLRVGVVTAKTFAYAVGAEVLGVDTLQTIANGLPEDSGTVPIFVAGHHAERGRHKNGTVPLDSPQVSVAVDAQRGDVVAQSFARDAAGWFQPAGPQELLAIDAWLAGLAPGTVVAGPVLKKLLDRLPAGVVAAEARYWHPRAGVVARLAAWLYASGHRDDLWTLSPRYSRRSAAEEKWEKTRMKDEG